MKRIFFSLLLLASLRGMAQTNSVDTAFSVTVSSATSLAINFGSFYTARHFTIFVYNIVPATSGTSLLMLTSPDGSSYDNSSGNYTWEWNNKQGYSQNSPSDVSITMSGGGGLQNSTGLMTCGVIEIYNPSGSSYYQNIHWDLAVAGTGNSIAGVAGAGGRLNQAIIKAIRLQMSSGNISGTAVVQITR